MRKIRAAACVLAVCCLSTSAIAAAGNSPGDAVVNRCVGSGSNARIAWTAPAAGAVRSARLYFRSANAKSEHFVEMRRGAASAFTAILPKPAPGAAAIDYRIAAAGAGGLYTTKAGGRLTIGRSCVADALTEGEQKQAASIVVGVTAEGPVVPVGFRCDGIVGEVTAKGELHSYSACSEIAIASMTASMAQPAFTPVADGTRASAGATKATSLATTGGKSIPQAATNGLAVGPLHHRTQRRAANPATPPQPRLQEPVSPSRPPG